MLIYLIAFLAAILEVNSQIVIDPTSCGHVMRTMQAAKDEMLDMCLKARTRIANVWSRQTPESELIAMIYLFDSFFGILSDQQAEAHARRVLCKPLLINIY